MYLCDLAKIGIIATDEPYGRGLANALNRALDDLDEVTTMPVVLFNHSADYDGILNAVRKVMLLCMVTQNTEPHKN